VLGQDLQQRDANDGLELACDGADKRALQVLLHSLCPAPTCGVRVLPGVDGRVEPQRDPDDGGARGGQLDDRLHLGPPRCAIYSVTHEAPTGRRPAGKRWGRRPAAISPFFWRVERAQWRAG
jgi:hypothetical protein